MDGTLPALIEQMGQPGFYAHPVQEPIRLVQTHISYVLLTGDYAYKVKKPVSFGFLDFTTLEQRHYYCQEELRLNRRLSPALYLAVLPIVEDAGRYRLGLSNGEKAVEYVLQMRQFPQESLFSHLFHTGQLTPARIQDLAHQVVQFHAQAVTSAEIQAYGSLAAVQQVEANNYALSEPFIGRTQTQPQYDDTRAFSTQFLAEHADELVRRQTAGKVRECHGDLHLNNVCLYQNQIQIFDCIEFNREFRNIDVIYDIAFMVMDLDFQGRGDLANIFLNTYLEETGDYEGAVLLPLYLSMRAYIRANVNSFALDDPAIPSAEKATFRERGKAYYHLAWRYTRRSPGRLILMSGVSGSGKSTVARQLAQRLNALHLRSDAVRKHLAGMPLHERGGNHLYTPEMTQQTYDHLLSLGILLAGRGWTVILDAKYDRAPLRQQAIAAAANAQIPLQIVQCVAPVAVLRDRLQTRSGDITDATADLLDAQLATADPFSEAEQRLTAIVQTDQELENQLNQILL